MWINNSDLTNIFQHKCKMCYLFSNTNSLVMTWWKENKKQCVWKYFQSEFPPQIKWIFMCFINRHNFILIFTMDHILSNNHFTFWRYIKGSRVFNNLFLIFIKLHKYMLYTGTYKVTDRLFVICGFNLYCSTIGDMNTDELI